MLDNSENEERYLSVFYIVPTSYSIAFVKIESLLSKVPFSVLDPTQCHLHLSSFSRLPSSFCWASEFHNSRSVMYGRDSEKSEIFNQ
eukprot:UN23115